MNIFLGKPKTKYILLISTCIIMLFTAMVFYIFLSGNTQNNAPTTKIVITDGMTASELAAELEAKGVLKHKLGFLIMGKVYNYDTQIHPGIFYLTPDMRISTIWNAILFGNNELIVRITIPEGFTVEQIADLLEQKNLVKSAEFKKIAKNFAPYDYMKPATENPDTKYAVEGFLFPDTYEISKESSAEDILKLMINNFNKKFTPEKRKLAESRNISIYQVVTLASIVEKEAKLAQDRPIIAQVFFSRLQIDMPLQSDATIQYASDKHIDDFTIAHTKMETPYNTYLHYGLTPGPICNPGIDSIDAVLNPATTDYLYFVADKDGTNHFSKTYAEHENNIQKIYGAN